MIDSLFHLPDSSASELAEGSHRLTQGEKKHLAGCQKCRDLLAFTRELSTTISSLDNPTPGEHLLPAIRRRLAAGERLLLPITVGKERPAGTKWATVAALLLIGLSLWIAWPGRGISAGPLGGELVLGSFIPGNVMDVTYRDHGAFHGTDKLRLRARLRTSSGSEYNFDSYQVVVAGLERNGESFHGRFVVPRDAVFAAFAVENLTGQRVDANGGRLWTRLARGPTGGPTFEAFTQAMYDVMGVSPEMALQIVRQRAKNYPERVDGWGELVGYETFMLGQAHADSAAASHIRRLRSFHVRFMRDAAVPLQISNGIRGYAIQLEEKSRPEVIEIGRYWDKRVRADTTDGPGSRERRLSRIASLEQTNPHAALDSMERAWQAGDSVVGFAAGNGRNFALRTKDSSAILIWTERFARRHTNAATFAYGELLADPRLRTNGLDGLRLTLKLLYAHSDSLRPLDRTTVEQARVDSAMARDVLARIADGLFASGRTRAALDTADLATRDGWSPALFRRLASGYLLAGDTLGALRRFAFVAVDPETALSFGDSVRSMTGLSVVPPAWPQLLQEARGEMRRRVLADAVRIPLLGAPRVGLRTGEIVSLEELAKGSVHVVTFWSQHCAPSRFDFAQLDTLSARLRSRGIRLFPITAEAPSPALDAFITEQRISSTVYYDVTREAGRAFDQWATPVYYVVDGTGVVRFTNSNLAKVARQAIALQEATSGPRRTM